jgi:hypothetical protein
MHAGNAFDYVPGQGTEMVNVFMLTVVLILSAVLAVGTARGVLAVVLHLMRLAPPRPVRW